MFRVPKLNVNRCSSLWIPETSTWLIRFFSFLDGPRSTKWQEHSTRNRMIVGFNLVWRGQRSGNFRVHRFLFLFAYIVVSRATNGRLKGWQTDNCHLGPCLSEAQGLCTIGWTYFFWNWNWREIGLLQPLPYESKCHSIGFVDILSSVNSNSDVSFLIAPTYAKNTVLLSDNWKNNIFS